MIKHFLNNMENLWNWAIVIAVVVVVCSMTYKLIILTKNLLFNYKEASKMQEKKYRVRAVLLYLAGIACFIAYCYFANLFPRFFEIIKNIITFLSN